MPVYNYFTKRNNQIVDEQITLYTAGPIVEVEISIPNSLATFYTRINLPIPTPKTGFAIIDTGCKITSVDDGTIKGLGVSPVGVGTTNTAAGQVTQNIYPAHVKLPRTTIEIDYNSVFSSDLSKVIFNGQPIIALIGRDILAHCVFIYNGKSGMYTFAY